MIIVIYLMESAYVIRDITMIPKIYVKLVTIHVNLVQVLDCPNVRVAAFLIIEA